METLDEFLARGGKVQEVPAAKLVRMPTSAGEYAAIQYDPERIYEIVQQRDGISLTSISNNLGCGRANTYDCAMHLVQQGRLKRRYWHCEHYFSLV